MAEATQVRYAVVGLGHIAQAAVLPAFEHAENSRLVALVSSEERKRAELSERYGIEHCAGYDGFDDLLKRGIVDAVYVALPNDMHAEYTVRAARAGVHVLCEKPMALSEAECRRMIEACEESDVRLMLAYRLHFEGANLHAVRLARDGKLGELRYFTSAFSIDARAGNIRLEAERGGGSVWDLGVYCINAARYLFRDEPFEVFAWSASRDERRFEEVDEMTSAVLRFPGDRLATFTSSLGAARVSSYRLVGTRGDVRVEPAYEYRDELTLTSTIDGESTTSRHPARDQFAAELVYFSRCIAEGRTPEPDGWEGLIDVRIIEAIYRSAREGRPIRVEPIERGRRPEPHQEIALPPLEETPPIVEAESPSKS